LTAKELLRHWQTEQVTGQMATWREWRAWCREFKSLGIRQVKEREARSIWHQEKQQAARWWLREQELLPYVITALALRRSLVGELTHGRGSGGLL
jgi:hypothetical protein